MSFVDIRKNPITFWAVFFFQKSRFLLQSGFIAAFNFCYLILGVGFSALVYGSGITTTHIQDDYISNVEIAEGKIVFFKMSTRFFIFLFCFPSNHRERFFEFCYET